MLSLRADCEGQRVLGVVAAVYDVPPTDVVSRPLYRCHLTTEHTVANTADCGGAPWVADGLLGYAVDRTVLVSYQTLADRAADTAAVPGMYRTGAALGLLAPTGAAGTVPLLSCLRGTDRFLSRDAGCEGATVLGTAGGVWSADPGSGTTLYRCRDTNTGDLFASNDSVCDGETVDGFLGYLAVRS
jgi:hypothetical protein